ncbi:MAG: hypothetical protein U0802_06010 [Candidatus Binatia bacterium]
MAKDERDHRRRPGAKHRETAFAGTLMAVVALTMLFDDDGERDDQEESGGDDH